MTLAAVSWSGGKDCCLALHRVREAGFDVRYLLAMFDETGERTRSHAIPREVMEAQAEALGMELVAGSASWGDYEQVFVGALKDLKQRGVGDVVFGDIDLQPHRDWEEKVCAAALVVPHLPLWQEDRGKLAREVLDRGYRPLVVCTDDRYLDASWCGRLYDAAYVASLPPGVDACGENGEFHTFVTDGPLFRFPVPAAVATVDTRELTFADKAYVYHYARLTLDRGDA
jgi:diphthine-ammonia ligase